MTRASSSVGWSRRKRLRRTSRNGTSECKDGTYARSDLVFDAYRRSQAKGRTTTRLSLDGLFRRFLDRACATPATARLSIYALTYIDPITCTRTSLVDLPLN